MSSTILPNTLALQVASALKGLENQRVLPRLWDHDATLWTSDSKEGQVIRQRLGWLSIVPVMEAQVGGIQALADRVRQDGYTHALLLGMGGSSLFPEICRHIWGRVAGWLDLAVVDSTDPTAITTAAQRAPLERTLFIVSSKSGTTIESNALGDYFYDQVCRRRGARAGEQFLAITDAGTPLERYAMERGFRRVFLHGPTTGQTVGGRFSALTHFGLVPAALMGLEIPQLLHSATAMLEACGSATPLADNPAAQLGALFGVGAASGKEKVTLLCSPSVSRFGTWAEQLIAESTGKGGKGLIPIHGEPVRDPATYSPDRIFVELQLADEHDAPLARQVEALARAGHPVVRIQWQDRYELGGETIRWFFATAIAAGLMGLNPFDEPDVQASKDRTKAMLDRFVREGRLPSEPALAADGPAAIYGDSQGASTGSPSHLVQHFLRHTSASDYVAILSFLPRTTALDTAVEQLRYRLAETLRVATMVGFGPRYLHSIGQLHKGGSDRARLLLLTAEDPLDLPIPGRPYSFSVLKQAQALGDFQALRDRHRRVLRVHLGSLPEAAALRFLNTLSDSMTSTVAKSTV